MEFNHKDIWTIRGKGFCVEVSRHFSKNNDDFDGGNRWCIYAYIFDSHPHFNSFKGDAMWQDAANAMPLYKGCSYLKYLYDFEKEKPYGVQVGCDYNHLYDEQYTHMKTKEDAYRVFKDAEDLFYWLKNKDNYENLDIYQGNKD